MCQNSSDTYPLEYFYKSYRSIMLNINLTDLRSQQTPITCSCTLSTDENVYLYQTVTMRNGALLQPQCIGWLCDRHPGRFRVPFDYRTSYEYNDILDSLDNVVYTTGGSEVEWRLRIANLPDGGPHNISIDVEITNKDFWTSNLF